MKIPAWIAVAFLAVITAGCARNDYDNRTPASSRDYDLTDFNGQWQLVTSRSDYGQNWVDDRNRFDADNTWGTQNTDRVRYGGWFLPDEFRITGDRQMLHIEDTGGGPIADVPFDSGYRYGSYDEGAYENSDRGLHARWVSNRRFQVERVGRSGRRMVQTFTLENRGRQLVVSTQVERDGATRSYTRVYDRL